MIEGLLTAVENRERQAERWALVERVAASRQIRRAARLRDFLLFVGRQSILEGMETIREQEIGEAVFGREAHYDTSLDNIVRVNATELRKRVDIFFEEEGAGDALIFTLPRGSYTPVFSHRVPAATAAFYEVEDAVEGSTSPTPATPTALAAPAAATSPVPVLPFGTQGEPPIAEPAGDQAIPAASRPRWLVLALLLTVALLAAALFWQRVQFRAATMPWRSDRALEAVWSPFFGTADEVDLVVGDTSLALAKDIAGAPVPLSSYIRFQYRDPGWVSLPPDRHEDLAQVLNRATVSLGDVHVALQVQALDPQSRAVHLFSAREFGSEAVRHNNVVLIGSRESNPWVDLFKDQVNFLVDYDPVTHRPFVRNRAPRSGEQAVYEPPVDAQRETGFAVVCVLPGITEKHHAMLISGTDAQATQAAGEFITNPALLSQFLDRLHGTPPRAFEVLLRTTQLTGTPLRSEVVAVRLSRP